MDFVAWKESVANQSDYEYRLSGCSPPAQGTVTSGLESDSCAVCAIILYDH